MPADSPEARRVRFRTGTRGDIRVTAGFNVAGCTRRDQYRFLSGPISLPNADGIVSAGRLHEGWGCRAQAADLGEPESGWLFPSPKSASGHLEDVFKFYAPIGKVAGTKFWYHGLRNSFITVAERELLLPRSLTKRSLSAQRHHPLVSQLGSVPDGRPDRLARHRRVAVHDVVRIGAGRQIVQYDTDGNARAGDARLAVADFRIDSNLVAPVHRYVPRYMNGTRLTSL